MPEIKKTELHNCENCEEEFEPEKIVTFRHHFEYCNNQNMKLMKVCINCKNFLEAEEQCEYNINYISGNIK